MELWHEPASGDARCLADAVEVADSMLARLRGRMFTTRFPQGTALVFPFESADRRSVHMLAVPYPIDVIYLVDEAVTDVARLRPMIGLDWGRADTIVEVPAGVADGIEVGDRVTVTR